MVITIAVIMSIKNGEKFIERSFSSILNQTHLPDEIIVVDDGSTDKTLKELEFVKINSIVPVTILATTGLGRAKALNLAAKTASSTYIANLDVDDFWYINKLFFQHQVLSRMGDIGMIVLITGSKILYENDFDGKRGEINDDNCKESNGIVRLSKDRFYLSNPVNHSSIIYSRALYEMVGGYTESLLKQIDIDLWIKFILAGGIFYILPTKLTVKCIHSEQSYEASSDRVLYSWSAFKMSNHNLKRMNAPFFYHVLSCFKLVYNLMPSFIKILIRSLRNENA